jgi:hypothetical protein
MEQYWIYTPLILAIIAVITALVSTNKHRARTAVCGEISRNKKIINTLAEVITFNKNEFDNDLIKSFEHSKGFLIKSAKDLEDVVYLDKSRLFKNDERVDLENTYKAFSVVTDVLSFLDRVNSEDEIKAFMLNFKTAVNLALFMADKVLPQETKE